jgi:ribonucleotide monophosphatase NagD (HAD superfamily)
MQPTTIWTISDPADRATMTQVKFISLLFRSITIQVINNGRDAVLTIDDLKKIGPLAKDSAVSKIITNIESLFSNDSSISIIGNTLLNSQLVDLAAIIAK